MTIIKPNNKFISVKFLIFLGIVSTAAGFIYVLQYNSLVNARFVLKETQKAIVIAKNTNSELKGEIFSVTDPQKLSEIALNSNLVLEKNPTYINPK